MISPSRSMTCFMCATSLSVAAVQWDDYEPKLFDDCLARATQGKAEDEHTVGMAYLTGTGVERDPVEGESWVRKAAEQAYPDAEYRMGLIAEAQFDRGEDPDLVQTKEWFTRASKHASTDAAYSLALIFLSGRGGIVKNTDEATRLLTQAAEGGNSEASMYLSDLFWSGVEVAKNKDESLKWRIRAAQDGHTEARTKLSIDYLYGSELVTKNLTEAVKWLTQSANDDVLESQVMLAYLLSGDKDVLNLKESLKWFLKVVEQGHSEEICSVFYQPDQYLRKHSEGNAKALEWCNKESEAGNPNAQLAQAFLQKSSKLASATKHALGKELVKKWAPPVQRPATKPIR